MDQEMGGTSSGATQLDKLFTRLAAFNKTLRLTLTAEYRPSSVTAADSHNRVAFATCSWVPGLIAQSACVVTSPFATLDGWPDSAEPGQLASEDMPD